jgi:signal transduction histidine kinase/PAS domain-containing protein/CheY-like chemotaxis protein
VKKKSNKSGGIDFLRSLTKEKDISDQIINNSRSMISIINRRYIYEKVNTTFCNAHQVVNDSIVGKSLGDVWGHETFQKVIKSNIDLCFSGKTVKYEASFNTPQFGKRYFDVVFRPISIKTGEITHLLAETFDINDLKCLKQAAIDKEEEFRKFETNLPIGFLRCNPEGKILHANKAFLKIIECNDEVSITNLNLKSFYPECGLFEVQVDQLLECNTKSFGRIPLKKYKGSEIACRISGFLAVNERGTPSYIDFAVEDSSRELMLENRLLQAQKLETIGALAGGIAHDFNNILATISGYSEMLKDDLSEGSELSEKVIKIQRAVLKARSITNQILTFSRQVEQEKIPISVLEVLKETIGFIKSAVPSNIVVKSRIPRKNVNVFADPTQLFRVFINLMTNAIQSMEEKGGTLSVNLAIVEGKRVQHELNKDIVADEYVLLTFKDTGKGMEPSLIGRIFEPFFTAREVGKGTGLGLSVVQGIVSELEGEILVSSKKEKGSVFYVYLPVSKKYPDLSGKNDKRKKILFITGNKYESRILSLALENTGYELIYVSDRRNLIKVMAYINERPDLVIYMSDSKQIQTEDLVSVFRRLKINIPCILITDTNQSLLEQKLLNSGIIKQHLIKPVSLKEIRNAIQISIK